jgi:hypothetical protein
MSDSMLARFMTVKGQFLRAAFSSPKTPAAAHKGLRLVKRTFGTFRGGINFANLSTVREGIANGDRPEVGPLPWGEWEVFPHIIKHQGERYCRLYPVAGGKVSCEYTVDGLKVSRETFESYLRPSDRSKNEAPECFTVRLDHVDSLCGVDAV